MNESETKIRAMVEQGATKGMIRSAVKKLGTTDDEFERLYDQINSSHTGRVRGKGALSAIAGVIMVVAGCIAIGAMSSGEGRFGRSPLFLIGGGVLLAFRGFLTLASGVNE